MMKVFLALIVTYLYGWYILNVQKVSFGEFTAIRDLSIITCFGLSYIFFDYIKYINQKRKILKDFKKQNLKPDFRKGSNSREKSNKSQKQKDLDAVLA